MFLHRFDHWLHNLPNFWVF
jgi:hypothetical protein